MAYYGYGDYGHGLGGISGRGGFVTRRPPRPPAYPRFGPSGYGDYGHGLGGLSGQGGFVGASAYPRPPQGREQGAPAPPGQDPSTPTPPTQMPNFEDDPILARIRALAQQSITQAEAATLAGKQQLAIGYGDPKFAESLGLDKQYVTAAEGNPFSTTKELARTYQRRDIFGINRPLSDYHNLFYSTERGRQLGMSAEQNLRDNAQALQAVQARVAALDQALAQAKMNAMAQEIAAEQQARQDAWTQGGY